MAANKGNSSIPRPTETRKRKDAPSGNPKISGERRDFKRVKKYDSRSIVTQASDAALKDGQLDIQSFIQSREFEIKALQNGMQKAKNSLNTKALQKVPRDMRRRTASHNVKRLPKRLHRRAEKEMRDGNTPTITASKRKPRSSRGRIRAETAKRLCLLADKKRALKKNDESSKIETRLPRPKLRTNQLMQPPKPDSKFRKRQIHKTWLPTHLWHVKRAKLTEPKNPLWRFAIPITPTEKSYRPTHRASGARGAVTWDTSYMSTILLEGAAESMKILLTAVGLKEVWLWEDKGSKWRNGTRSWTGWLSRQPKDKPIYIGPSTVIWCPLKPNLGDESTQEIPPKKPLRQVFIRIHPAAFLETWTELLRLSKLQQPKIHMIDLRFEIGSIEITGPGSTEALLGILHPFDQAEDSMEIHAKTFKSLTGATNPGILPSGAVLAFSIMDPRLKYPPRPVKFPEITNEEASLSLVQLLSEWPVDSFSGSTALFDRGARFKASHLPSQKAINRRKGLAPPGSYPDLSRNDPSIPIVLLASRNRQSTSAQGSWTLLAPWKCILPIWLGLVHYPLSSGGNPRFGGLEELRQISFENEKPWFPADYLGTKSGFSWEMENRLKRKAEWEKRPKGKRIEWNSLDLGGERKGEIGCGLSNDFESLLKVKTVDEASYKNEINPNATEEPPVVYIPGKIFKSFLSSSTLELPAPNTVATVLITHVGRGIAMPCARIYRLPQESLSVDPSLSSVVPATTREQWLSLIPQRSGPKHVSNSKSKLTKSLGRIPPNIPLSKRVHLLSRSLLQEPPLQYPDDKYGNDLNPLVPDEKDIIGFVTTGKHCLSKGIGVAFGTVLVTKIIEALRSGGKNGAKGSRICVVRNAGESIGRLARWEFT